MKETKETKVGSIQITAQWKNQEVPNQLKTFLATGENMIDLVVVILEYYFTKKYTNSHLLTNCCR